MIISFLLESNGEPTLKVVF